MKIGEALREVAALGVDTAPFIYFVERHADFGPLIRPIFDRADHAELQIIASVIALLEVLVMPLQKGRRDIQDTYRAMFLNTRQVVTLSVTATIAERAALLRAEYSLRTPDAIHLATALEAGCDAFLTNDRGLARVRGIRVLMLDELEAD